MFKKVSEKYVCITYLQRVGGYVLMVNYMIIIGYWILFNIFTNIMVNFLVPINWQLFSNNHWICLFPSKFYYINSIFYFDYCICLAILSSKIWSCFNSPIRSYWNWNLFLFEKPIMIIIIKICYKTTQLYYYLCW